MLLRSRTFDGASEAEVKSGQVVLFGASNGIWLSRDFGETFKKASRNNTYCPFVSPNGEILGWCEQSYEYPGYTEIHFSRNGGVNFTKAYAKGTPLGSCHFNSVTYVLLEKEGGLRVASLSAKGQKISEMPLPLNKSDIGDFVSFFAVGQGEYYISGSKGAWLSGDQINKYKMSKQANRTVLAFANDVKEGATVYMSEQGGDYTTETPFAHRGSFGTLRLQEKDSMALSLDVTADGKNFMLTYKNSNDVAVSSDYGKTFVKRSTIFHEDGDTAISSDGKYQYMFGGFSRTDLCRSNDYWKSYVSLTSYIFFYAENLSIAINK